MRSHENILYDFTLVWTYLPVLIIILRSSFFLGLFYWWLFAINMPQHGILMLCASVVYIDSLVMQNSQFDRSCGHLCACVLAVLTQQGAMMEPDCGPAKRVALLLCDLLWGVCASADVLARTTGFSVPMPHLGRVLVSATFASTRVMCSCGTLGLLEALLRSALYYILCSLLILCAPIARQYERGSSSPTPLNGSVVYLCLHVFFVHLYAVVPSVMVIVALHARLIVKTLHLRGERWDDGARAERGSDGGSKSPSGKHSASKHAESVHSESLQSTCSRTAHTIPASQGPKEYSDLIMKLQAAKKASGMA